MTDRMSKPDRVTGLAMFLTMCTLACSKPHVVGPSSPPILHVQELRIPAPSEPLNVTEALSLHRNVRAVMRLSQCWAHAICTRSAPLWAKSVLLEAFHFSSKDMREVDSAYFQSDRYYVTPDAQILVAHHGTPQSASRWVDRTGHRWSLWRGGDVRAEDRAEMLFVLQPGWLAKGPRGAWITHEAILRTHKLVVGDGPWVEVHIEKAALSKRLPAEIRDAHVALSGLENGGADLKVTMNVTNGADAVAEKVAAILRDENGFVLRAATRDVLAGAEVRAEEQHVTVSIPMSALQATSLLKLASAYVGEEAEP